MTRPRRPFLMFAVLLAIGLRTVLGAPCCLSPAQAAEISASVDHAHHSEHAGENTVSDTGGDSHSGHGDDPSAKPCCSACGPTLPPEIAQFSARGIIRDLPAPMPIRALETRPPFPAYNATGPPLLI